MSKKEVPVGQQIDEILYEMREAMALSSGWVFGREDAVGRTVQTKALAEIIYIIRMNNQKMLSEVIKGNQQMYFSNTYPVFYNVKEYMEHVAMIREALRDEQWKEATKLGYIRPIPPQEPA